MMKVKVVKVLATQLCPTLCDSMDCSVEGSSVHGIYQARMLEWIAMSPSRDLPNSGLDPVSPALQADSLPSEPLGKPKSDDKWLNMEDLRVLSGFIMYQISHCKGGMI